MITLSSKLCLVLLFFSFMERVLLTKGETVLFIRYIDTFEGEVHSIRVSIPVAPRKQEILEKITYYSHVIDEAV